MAELWGLGEFLSNLAREDPEIQQLLNSISETLKKIDVVKQKYQSECDENLRLRLQNFHMDYIVSEQNEFKKELLQLDKAYKRINENIQSIESEKIAAFEVLAMELDHQKTIKEVSDERARKAKLLEESQNRNIVKEHSAKLAELKAMRQQLEEVKQFVEASELHRAESIRKLIDRRNGSIVRLVQGAKELELLKNEFPSENTKGRSDELKELEIKKEQLTKKLAEIEKRNRILEMDTIRKVDRIQSKHITSSGANSSSSSFSGFFDPNKFLQKLKSDFHRVDDIGEQFMKTMKQSEGESSDRKSDAPTEIESALILSPEPKKKSTTGAPAISTKSKKHVSFKIPECPDKSQNPVDVINLLTPNEKKLTEETNIQSKKKENKNNIEILENRLLKPPTVVTTTSSEIITSSIDIPETSSQLEKEIDESPKSSKENFEDFLNFSLKSTKINEDGTSSSHKKKIKEKIEKDQKQNSKPEFSMNSDFFESFCRDTFDVSSEIDFFQTETGAKDDNLEDNEFTLDFSGSAERTDNFL